MCAPRPGRLAVSSSRRRGVSHGSGRAFCVGPGSGRSRRVRDWTRGSRLAAANGSQSGAGRAGEPLARRRAPPGVPAPKPPSPAGAPSRHPQACRGLTRRTAGACAGRRECRGKDRAGHTGEPIRHVAEQARRRAGELIRERLPEDPPKRLDRADSAARLRAHRGARRASADRTGPRPAPAAPSPPASRSSSASEPSARSAWAQSAGASPRARAAASPVSSLDGRARISATAHCRQAPRSRASSPSSATSATGRARGLNSMRGSRVMLFEYQQREDDPPGRATGLRAQITTSATVRRSTTPPARCARCRRPS